MPAAGPLPPHHDARQPPGLVPPPNFFLPPWFTFDRNQVKVCAPGKDLVFLSFPPDNPGENHECQNAGVAYNIVVFYIISIIVS
jgi:hypothetical protein